VRAVDECEIDFDAGGLEAGQRLVRRQGLQFDETRIFCSFQMLDADALPIAELIRVDDDVMLGPDFRERFADVKRRNAVRTTDLDADSRLDLPDDLLETLSFVLREVGVRRQRFS